MPPKEFWRFKKYCSNDLKGLFFLEWKYFSFTHEDIKGFICYSVGNPKNILGLKRGIVSYAVYHEEGREIGEIEVSKKNLELNRKNLWVFGSTALRYMGKKSWEIKGDIDDLSWDLTFSQIVPGNRIRFDLDNKLFRDSWMDWLVFCNSAEVEGSITIKETKYEIKALGYYDSNYGHWNPSNKLWTWGHSICRSENEIFSFSMAESRFDNIAKGRMYVGINDTIFQFDSGEYELKYDTVLDLPSCYFVKGYKENGTTVKAKFEVEFSDKLTFKMFGMIPLLDLYLQRGTLHLEIKTPDDKTFNISCYGSWEFPKKTKIFRHLKGLASITYTFTN
ncbi:MAG: hypothetical protein R6W73_09985 [Candidatus Saliniplasma sp.]